MARACPRDRRVGACGKGRRQPGHGVSPGKGREAASAHDYRNPRGSPGAGVEFTDENGGRPRSGLRPLLRMARPAGLPRHRLDAPRREGSRGRSARCSDAHRDAVQPRPQARAGPRAVTDGRHNAGRKTIHFARFDAKRCAPGLESLRVYRTEWDEKARAFRKTPEHNWASHGADGWRCLSLSWRAPMREPEEKKLPIGLPLPDITIDQFMDIEDSWSMREDRV
jgi:hypothetical protein